MYVRKKIVGFQYLREKMKLLIGCLGNYFGMKQLKPERAAQFFF